MWLYDYRFLCTALATEGWLLHARAVNLMHSFIFLMKGLWLTGQCSYGLHEHQLPSWLCAITISLSLAKGAFCVDEFRLLLSLLHLHKCHTLQKLNVWYSNMHFRISALQGKNMIFCFNLVQICTFCDALL